MNRPVILSYIIIAGLCILAGIFFGSLFAKPENYSLSGQDPVSDAHSGSMVSPAFLTPSINNSVIISNEEGKSLYKINQNGTIDWVISEKSAQPYGFWHISGIGSDFSGNVYVSDEVTSRILVFDKNGGYKETWGEAGEKKGEFNSPGAIAVLSSGKKADDRIIICDTGNDRVQIFNTSGGCVGGFVVPNTVHGSIQADLQKQNSSPVLSDLRYVKPDSGANPRFVERTFTIQSSNQVIPVSLQVDRSFYLGSQKINRDRQDIPTKNPEEWAPVLVYELSDPVNKETVRTILDTLLYEGHSQSFDERQMVEFITHFVQQIPLTEETDNRNPVEILHDKKGNSFDKALLLYNLLYEYGYDVVFLAYPGFSHAGVGIRIKEHIQSDNYKVYTDGNGDEYLYLNPDGPSFFGGLASTFRSSDPFVLHLSDPAGSTKTFSGYTYSLYVVESIIKLYEKYQFLVNKEKEEKGDDAKKVRYNYQRIKNVLDFIEKNPSNTEGAYMRIKNSKVNDIIV